VPDSLMRGAAALGMTHKGQILGVALPAARVGIIGGILLSLARALGETMAVVMVAGNVVRMPHSVFEPVRVLTANIALEMAYATGLHRAGLFTSGLLLTALVLLLAALAARIAGKSHHG
jgi:phosphate transport system permease protein